MLEKFVGVYRGVREVREFKHTSGEVIITVLPDSIVEEFAFSYDTINKTIIHSQNIKSLKKSNLVSLFNIDEPYNSNTVTVMTDTNNRLYKFKEEESGVILLKLDDCSLDGLMQVGLSNDYNIYLEN